MSPLLPRLIVQRVRVEWSKASRGMPGAGRRNAVPAAFPLPRSVLRASSDVTVHHLVACEADEFRPRTVDALPGVDVNFRMLGFKFEDGAALISFGDDDWPYGGPRNIGVRGVLFRLEPGETASFRFNRRSAYSMGGRRAMTYHDEHFHFHAGQAPDADVFLHANRNSTIDRRVSLY